METPASVLIRPWVILACIRSEMATTSCLPCTLPVPGPASVSWSAASCLGSDGHCRKDSKLHGFSVHAGDSIDSDVRKRSSKEVLLRYDRHLGLSFCQAAICTIMCFAHDFSGRCLLNDKQALQTYKAPIQLLHAVRGISSALPGRRQGPLQYVLHLGQMSIGLPGSLRRGA